MCKIPSKMVHFAKVPPSNASVIVWINEVWLQRLQSGLSQSIPPQGSAVANTSLSFLPVLSSICIFSPLRPCISLPASLNFVARPPDHVLSTNNTALGSIFFLAFFCGLFWLVGLLFLPSLGAGALSPTFAFKLFSLFSLFLYFLLLPWEYTTQSFCRTFLTYLWLVVLW